MRRFLIGFGFVFSCAVVVGAVVAPKKYSQEKRGNAIILLPLSTVGGIGKQTYESSARDATPGKPELTLQLRLEPTPYRNGTSE